MTGPHPHTSPPGVPPSALLLLADGRFPAGGYAHSGGLEAVIAAGRVRDVGTLESFLRGRTATTGAVAAAFAASSCAAVLAGEDPARLDEELDARTPSPALRRASRKLGRQMLRAARAVWPHPALHALAAAHPGGPHQPIVLGVAAAAAGLGPHSAALAVVHDSATGPATAAVRLLGLDPFAVHALLARLGPWLDALAAEAAARAHDPPEDLPSYGAPLIDVSSEHHATWEVRLFAS